MTNEIKEILDDLRKTADNTIFVVCSSQEELDKMPKYTANFLSINDRKAKVLLDYITNLQNEIFDLKDTIHNKNDCIGAYECIIEDRDKRIDKAIEYLKSISMDKTPDYIPLKDYKEYHILLDILGDD